jgi:hypothetical protein
MSQPVTLVPHFVMIRVTARASLALEDARVIRSPHYPSLLSCVERCSSMCIALVGIQGRSGVRVQVGVSSQVCCAVLFCAATFHCHFLGPALVYTVPLYSEHAPGWAC